jgi:hypothetical protein
MFQIASTLVVVASLIWIGAAVGERLTAPPWAEANALYSVKYDSNVHGELVGFTKPLRFGTVIDINPNQFQSFAGQGITVLSVSAAPLERGLLVLRPALLHLCGKRPDPFDYDIAIENPDRGLHTSYPSATWVTRPVYVPTIQTDERAAAAGGCRLQPTWTWLVRITSYMAGTYRFRLFATYRVDGRVFHELLARADTYVFTFRKRYQSDGEFCPGPRCGYITP